MSIFATWQECMVKIGMIYLWTAKILDQSLVEISGESVVP